MQPADEKLNTAVIGLGPHGMRIVGVVAEMPQLRLAAVVDQRAEALNNPSLPADCLRLSSADELFARGDMQVVCIATNGPSHAPLALAAMDSGARYVLVEKPMACSLEECDAIISAAKATGSRVVVSHGRRYAQPYLWIAGRIASGDWGQLRSIWIQRPGIGLGCNAVHSFDMVAMLAGGAVERVTGWVDPPLGKNPRGPQFVDPGGLVVMELAGGVRGIVAQIEDGAGPTSIEIDLTAARVRIDERSGHVEIIERDLSVKPGPGRPPAFREASLPVGLSGTASMPAMLRGCLEELVGGSGEADGTTGRLAVEVLIAAYESQDRGNVPVRLPLEAPDVVKRWLPVT